MPVLTSFKYRWKGSTACWHTWGAPLPLYRRADQVASSLLELRLCDLQEHIGKLLNKQLWMTLLQRREDVRCATSLLSIHGRQASAPSLACAFVPFFATPFQALDLFGIAIAGGWLSAGKSEQH